MFLSFPWNSRVGRGVNWLVWCALAVALSLWLARAIMLWDVVGLVPLLACLALGLMVWIILYPTAGFYVFLAVNFLLPRLVDYGWIPLSTFWLNDLVVASWLIHAAFRTALRRRLPRTPFDLPIALFAVVFCLSVVVNALGPTQIAIGLRYYFKYVVAFYMLMALGIPRVTLRRALVVLCVLAFLEVPIALLQYFAHGMPADGHTGTLNMKACGLMTFWQLSVASLLISGYFTGLISARVASLAGLCVIPSLLSTVQAIFFFAPFVMIALLVPNALTRNLRAVRKYVGLTITVSVVFAGISALAAPEHREKILADSTAYIRSVDKAVQYSDTQGGGRLASLKDAWKAVQGEWTTLFFGLGPGSSSESQYRVRPAAAQVPKVTVTQIDFLLVDLGILGVLLPLVVVAVAFWVNLRAFWNARSRFDRTVTHALFAIIPLYGIFFWYLPCWITDITAILFWLFMAYIVPLSRRPRLRARFRHDARSFTGAAS